LFDVSLNMIGKVLDRYVPGFAVFAEDPLGLSGIPPCYLGISLRDIAAFQQGLLASNLPAAACNGLVGRLKILVLATAVQIALELCDVPLFAVIDAHLVEDFDKNSQQGIDLRLADDVSLLVNIEQDAARRDGDGF